MCNEEQIRQIVHAEIEPVRALLEEHNERIDSLETWRDEHLEWTAQQLAAIHKRFDEQASSSDTHTEILQTIADRLERTEDIVDSHDRRLNPWRGLWEAFVLVWGERRRIVKTFIIIGGTAAAVGQILSLWLLISEWFM